MVKMDKKDLLFEDFKPIRITKNIKEDILKNSTKYRNCPSRIKMGLFYTDKEYEKYVENSLKRLLPGEDEIIKKLIFRRKKVIK